MSHVSTPKPVEGGGGGGGGGEAGPARPPRGGGGGGGGGGRVSLPRASHGLGCGDV